MRSKAVVIPYGVPQTGRREVISIDLGEAEPGAFWVEFLVVCEPQASLPPGAAGHGRRRPSYSPNLWIDHPLEGAAYLPC